MVAVPSADSVGQKGMPSSTKGLPETPEQWSLAYLKRGWSVIPVHRGEKHPMVRWAEYQTRCPKRDEVQTWYTRQPDANVGIVTGSVSGIVVLDVDAGHGGDESLQSLERRHGTLQPTVTAITGGGGRHFYFRHPGGRIQNRVGVHPGIDLRGDGGYVVAPPSLHPSGKHYTWAESRSPLETEPAPLPPWLLEVLARRAASAGHPLSYWRRLTKEGVPEGKRNNTIASLAGHLLWHEVDPDVTLELLLGWNALRCRPPLSVDEVTRTVRSISRLHQAQESEQRKGGDKS